jgi:nitrous oxide reductase accessory protein NosL
MKASIVGWRVLCATSVASACLAGCGPSQEPPAKSVDATPVTSGELIGLRASEFPANREAVASESAHKQRKCVRVADCLSPINDPKMIEHANAAMKRDMQREGK